MENKTNFIVENFKTFGIASILYGIFFTCCLFQNLAGLSLPVFAAASVFYYCFCMKKLGLVIKKDSVFYMISILLLSVATVLTDNSFFIFWNYAGMLLLLLTCLIHNFYDDKEFKLSHYLYSLMSTCFGSIGFIAYPFRSFNRFLEGKSKKDSKGRYVWYGILISIPLLFVIMSLLMSADAVFRNMFASVFKMIILPENTFGIIFMTCLGMFGSYLIIINLASHGNSITVTDRRTKEPLIAITFTSVLSAIYLLFCFIQIFGLFLGNLQLPEGYTYAKYAREGFFQLLFVCILNLLIVLFCIGSFKENKVLKIILSVFCGCTMIMTASCAMRMILYTKAYDLSLDRVLVLWTSFVIALLMICVFIHIFKNDFPLFQYGVMIVTVCYILLSFSRPDTYIAKYNIQASGYYENEKTMKLDYYYLFHYLSADAAPVLDEAGILKPVKEADPTYGFDDRLSFYYGRLYRDPKEFNIRNFNYSRYRAAKIMEKYTFIVPVETDFE